MAELKINEGEVSGIAKEIDAGSMSLVFDGLQSDMYAFPIKSFIRETVSNGIDSITEKNTFRAIEAGEDTRHYYREKQDGQLLKHSEYNPDYYNNLYLDSQDKVTVTYINESPRDIVIVKDTGVGLDNKRLQGFTSLGFSTKRNLFNARGKFGLGSKTPLATGADYYIVTTVYNGKKTALMIYNTDYEAITPETDTTTSVEWDVKMVDGTFTKKKIYWEMCDEPNSVSIEVEIKKHNKTELLSAVRDQFQYFEGLVCIDEKEGRGDNFSYLQTLDTEPIYNSSNIIIPRYSTYYVPHILVDGISYGVINWKELELETRKGRIAIRVGANDVDITQSRESLKWTEKTKKAVLVAVKNAEEEAQEVLENSMKAKEDVSVFSLNNMFSDTLSSGNNASIAIFNQFLDTQIKPKYTLTVELDQGEVQILGKLSDTFFNFMFYSFDFAKISVKTSRNKLILDSQNVRQFDNLTGAVIVYGNEKLLGPAMAQEIMDRYDTTSFVYVTHNETRIKNFITYRNKEYTTSSVKRSVVNMLAKYSDVVLDTCDYYVDEKKNGVAPSLSGASVSASGNRLATLRKINKEAVWMTYNSVLYRDKKVEKIAKIGEIIKSKLEVGVVTVVVPYEYTKMGQALVRMNEYAIKYFDAKFVNFVFTSKEVSTYFFRQGAEHIVNYVRKYEEGVLTLCPEIRALSTAHKLCRILSENPVSYIPIINKMLGTEYDGCLFSDSLRVRNLMPDEILQFVNKMLNLSEALDNPTNDVEVGILEGLDIKESKIKVHVHEKNMLLDIESCVKRCNILEDFRLSAEFVDRYVEVIENSEFVRDHKSKKVSELNAQVNNN